MLQPKKRTNLNAATRQDSVDVKTDSNRILKEYLDKGYVTTNVKFPDETLDQTLTRAKNNTRRTQVIRDNVRKSEKYDATEFRTDINENQFRQRESANGVLNMDITPALYDKRIKPVRTINLMGTREGTYNDGVSIPSYASMKISPKPPENVEIIKPREEIKNSTVTTPIKREEVKIIKPIKKEVANSIEKVIPKIESKKVIKPTSKYLETVEPQADTLSKQTLGVNRIRETGRRAIKTLNIVKPRK